MHFASKIARQFGTGSTPFSSHRNERDSFILWVSGGMVTSSGCDDPAVRAKLEKRMRAPAIVSSLLMSMLLSGCFVSNVTAIPPQSAEDLGPELSYGMFVASEASDPDAAAESDVVRIVRGETPEYRMLIGDAVSSDITVVAPDSVYLRRLGERAGDPVYVVQMDLDRAEVGLQFDSATMGFKYLFYPVAIDGSGDGSVGFLTCPLRDSGNLARQYSVELVCAGGIATNTPRVVGEPDSEDLWKFLEAALAAELFDWEDERNESVMSWIQ
jgi:hypothetical protein